MQYRKKINYLISRIFFLYIPLTIFLIFALFPFYWMVITSIKPNQEFMTQINPLFVDAPTLDQYKKLFLTSDFPIWIKNSLVVSLVTTAISVIISCLAAYSIVRIKFPGREIFSQGVLFSYLIPRTIIFIPLFQVIRMIGLTDTVFGLMLAYLTFMVPFCTWLLIGFFAGVPKEIEECATIDGCNRFKCLIYIVIPIVAPGIVTAAIFSFILSWSEYLYPLVLNTATFRQVVPVGISQLITGDLYEWGQIMAAGVIFAIPVLILSVLVQSKMVEGLTSGAVKG